VIIIRLDALTDFLALVALVYVARLTYLMWEVLTGKFHFRYLGWTSRWSFRWLPTLDSCMYIWPVGHHRFGWGTRRRKA